MNKKYIILILLIPFIKSLSCPEVQGTSLNECRYLETYDDRYCCYFSQTNINTGIKQNFCVEISAENVNTDSALKIYKNQVDERCASKGQTCNLECNSPNYIINSIFILLFIFIF